MLTRCFRVARRSWLDAYIIAVFFVHCFSRDNPITLAQFFKRRTVSQHHNYVNPLTLTVAIWTGTAIKHAVQDRVKPSFVIFDILAL